MHYILDLDTGTGTPGADHDDGHALGFALRAGLNVVGVTTSPGNVPTKTATRNTLRLLECFQRPDIPVAPGRDDPLMYDASSIREFYDKAGKSELAKKIWKDWKTDRPKIGTSEFKAYQLIIEISRQHPGDVTLILCASLTNLALAILVEPDVTKWIKQVFYLGLMITDPNPFLHPLDRPPRFMNDSYDSDALEIVVKSNLKITFITSDAAFQVPLFGKDDLEKLGAINHPINCCLGNELAPWINFVEERYEMTGCGLPDLLAVATAIDPSLITTGDYFLDINRHRIEDEEFRYPYLFKHPQDSKSIKVLCAYEADGDRFMQLYWNCMLR